MTLTRPLAILAVLLAAILAPAARCRAQFGLPEDLIKASDLTAAQKQAITQFIDQHKAGLTAEPQVLKRDRDALLDPLRHLDISVSFRLEYARQLVPILRPLVSGEKDLAAINALTIAGELATSSSLDMAGPALADKRPAVRFAGVNAFDRTFVAIARTNPAIAPPQAQSAVRTLRDGLAKESDPYVLEGYVLALQSGTHVWADRIKGSSVRPDSLLALTQGIGAKARDAKPGVDLDAAFRRAARAARDALVNVPLSEPKLDDAVLRDVGALGGDLLANIKRRVEAGELKPNPDPPARKRAELALMAADSEQALNFASSQLGTQSEELHLGDLIERSKDDDFLQKVRRVIGPKGLLNGAPFNFPDDRFTK